jgi:tetratricopeptide (TPR) repeat protein
MGFWRKEVIEPALDAETLRHVEEQQAWINREPANAKPYFHLAQLYRIQLRQDEALGLLLESVRLDPHFASAHVALAEIYAVREDYPAAWCHARAAERHGEKSAVALLARHNIAEPPPTGDPPEGRS